jgi:hypothetical protein
MGSFAHGSFHSSTNSHIGTTDIGKRNGEIVEITRRRRFRFRSRLCLVVRGVRKESHRRESVSLPDREAFIPARKHHLLFQSPLEEQAIAVYQLIKLLC